MTDDETEPYRPNCYLYAEVRDGLRMGWDVDKIVYFAHRVHPFRVGAVTRSAEIETRESASVERRTR